MSGRHARPTRSRRGLRWIAGAGAMAAAAAAATVLATAPAGAATTTTAQLSLSGVADQANVLGGTTIGVHPGDTVEFKASSLPTAGLDNVPTLGPVLNNVLSALLGSTYQVKVTFSPAFPGGDPKTFTLGGPTSGACKGDFQTRPVTFDSIGTYDFTWTVQYVAPGLLGGCTANGLNSTSLNLLKQAGVALNAGNQWTGRIVVADNPPAGGISIQLPGVSVAPSLPVVGALPGVGLPGVVSPTLPVTVPSLPSLPGPTKSTKPTAGSGSSGGGNGGIKYTPPQLTIPEIVMGGGLPISGGSGFGGVQPNSGDALRIGSGLSDVVAPVKPSETVAAPPIAPGPATSNRTVELAANRAPAAQLPVLLAVLAIIALALVTGTYAKLFLLRRPTA